ncbi:hypothetical protein QR680_010143 [Steinernema hermaphroditum]|uniref:G-protein coupled receptors family 1 profile domain-containing protein n=1 Tax=Steinernema hermaphroditum TaxID=289476 RepID=A0AA39MB85_9BILA|nr:hypothetical protein QR680_010143 [Steinernema hermaphroditum]
MADTVDKTLLAQYVQLGVCLFTLVVNGFVIVQNATRKLDVTQQLSMVFVKLVLETVYTICLTLYSGCAIADLKGVTNMEDFIYLTGNISASVQLAMALTYFFTAVDRYFAMKKPIVYSQYYNCYVKRASITLGVLIFLCGFFIYAVTRGPAAGPSSAFNSFVNHSIHSFFHTVQLIFFTLSVVLMIICALRLGRFLRKKRAKFMGSFVENVKAANKVVSILTLSAVLLVAAPLAFEVAKDIGSLNVVKMSPMFTDIGYMVFSAISSIIFYCATKPQCKTSPSPPISYI